MKDVAVSITGFRTEFQTPGGIMCTSYPDILKNVRSSNAVFSRSRDFEELPYKHS
jgi:hypothetical protein